MKYGVYIIESLRSDDDFWDGENLSQILNLTRISNHYAEVASIEDFEREVDNFNKLDFRYLHLSFHGDIDGITINGEDVSNDQLSQILNPVILKKRVFMSSCKGSNLKLASPLIVNGGCQSLIGTPTDLDFDKAALFWPSFYHVIHSMDSSRMNQKLINKTIKKCVDLFRIPINYYHVLPKRPKCFLQREKFRPGKRTDNRRIRVMKSGR